MYVVLRPTTIEESKRQDAKAFSNFVIQMDKQDPAHPAYVNNTDAFCWWAKRSADTAAADRYLEIELQEVRKYGGRPEIVEMLLRTLDRHKSLGNGK
jgi:hypothetical protein